MDEALPDAAATDTGDTDPPTSTPTPTVSASIDADALAAYVDARITKALDAHETEDDHTPPADQPLGGPVTRDQLGEDVQALLADVETLFAALDPQEIAALLDRLDESLDTFEETMGLRAVIGPSVPEDAYHHSTPGWGIVFQTDGPLQFGQATVVSNQPGETYAEIHAYDGDSQGLVDSTHLQLPSTGEQTVDLDLSVEEAGTYLLTRDYQALDDGQLQTDERIAMWRTHDDWDGWGEVSNGLLTLVSAAHPDFGSEPKLWYYFFDCHVHAAAE